MFQLCCHRQRRAAVTSGVLEGELLQVLDALDAGERRVATYRRAKSFTAGIVGLWPVIVAVLAGAFIKLELSHVLKAHWLLALGIAVVPEMLSMVTSRVCDTQLARTEKAMLDMRKKRSDVLQQIKTELPMNTALPLLMKYDPNGDHRVCGRALSIVNKW